jgi:hypothetical protein
MRGMKQDWMKTRSRGWQPFGCLVLSRQGKSDIEPLFWGMTKLHARKSIKAHRQVVQDDNSSKVLLIILSGISSLKDLITPHRPQSQRFLPILNITNEEQNFRSVSNEQAGEWNTKFG